MARKFFGVVAAVALASGAMFALVGPASAATTVNSFTVIKLVSGPVPSGTVFSVSVSCTGTGGPTANLYFDATGHASNASGTQITAPVITPNLNNTCTASETFSGGASSISYSCSASGTLTTCSGNNAVNYGDTTTGVGTITITNTFSSTTTTTSTTIAPAVTTLPPVTTTTLAPKPAPKPVVASANFTG